MKTDEEEKLHPVIYRTGSTKAQLRPCFVSSSADLEGSMASSDEAAQEKVTVHIRCTNGSKFSVDVSLDTTINSLKPLLVEGSGVAADQQRLIYKGRVLKDESTLESYEDGDAEENAIDIFTGHSDSVFAVACSPTDHSLVATGGGDDKAYIWKIRDSASPIELKNHSDSVASLAFSNDGQLLASGGLDGITNIWDAVSGSLKHKLEGPSEAIEWVKWHPRGHVVLVGSEDFTSWMWNADTGACLSVFAGHNGSVTCGNFTPDGKTVCTGSADAALRVWNPKSGQSVHIIQGHPYHSEGLTCLDIGIDSSVVISGSLDSSVQIVNIRTAKVVASFDGHSKSIECVGFAQSVSLAASGGMDGLLQIWDLHSSTQRSTCQHEEGVVNLLWSQTSSSILTGCLDGKIRLWDTRTGTCEKVYHGHEDAILDMSLSQGETFVVSSSDDHTVRVFEL